MSAEILFKQPKDYIGKVVMDSWIVKLNDFVTKDQPICHVRFGEELYEVFSPESGIVSKKFYQDGERIDGLPILGVVGNSDSSFVDLKPATNHIVSQDKITKIKGVRKIVAQRMYESLQDTAQFTIHTVADARGVLELREKCKKSKNEDFNKISINDILIWIVSRVLEAYPYMNALMTSEGICQHGQIHLGFAVDTPRGLIVPVIKNIRMLSLKGVAKEAKNLVSMCMSGKFPPDILENGTFTVTNLGSFGVGLFTPIVNVPQIAILGIGGIELKPILENGQVEHVPHFLLSLTIDHRAVDGAPAAKFLSAFAKAIAQIQYFSDDIQGRAN